MKIIIAGAGAVGTHLAKLLSREDQDIVLMDENAEKLAALNSNFDLMTVNASPTSIAGLKEANAAGADLFIGVTPEETKNMTCCMIAHAMGAKKTVARIDNYEYLNTKHLDFFKKMGINSLIYPEMLAAKEIVNGIKMSWARQWWEVHNGALTLLGIKLRESAEVLDQPLKDLCGPDTPYHIVAIKRDDEIIIPRGDSTLKLYDIAYFMTTRRYIPYIRKIVGKENYADVRTVMIMGGGRTAMRAAINAPDYMNIKNHRAGRKTVRTAQSAH
jgi:trk system potassium uptake protein TrkA